MPRSFEESLELIRVGGVLAVMPLEFEHARLGRRAGSSCLSQPNTPKQIGSDRLLNGLTQRASADPDLFDKLAIRDPVLLAHRPAIAITPSERAIENVAD